MKEKLENNGKKKLEKNGEKKWKKKKMFNSPLCL